MMNFLKKNVALLSAAALCLGLSACGASNKDLENPDIVGNDWRVTGVVRDNGTITRNGEDTEVLVCVHTEDTAFYYDTEEQMLFDAVYYPIILEGDPWEMFKSIDFADLNGDGNSDVTMKFDDSGSELLMVWFWNAENVQFMFQPDESNIGVDEGRGDLIPEYDDEGDPIPEDDGRGDLIPEYDDEGNPIPEDDGRGDLIPEYDDEGNPIPEDDGKGDLIPDDGEGNIVPVLMGGALPFTNMENLKSENYEDGTYYYEDVTEDGLLRVVNTVMPSQFMYDDQTLEDYLTVCATSLGESDSCVLQSVEQNDEYTEKMSYPVYVVTYIVGENEDAREWTVFAMDTDSCTYLYGFCTALDAAEDVRSVYQDIFAGLYLSDGEMEE